MNSCTRESEPPRGPVEATAEPATRGIASTFPRGGSGSLVSATIRDEHDCEVATFADSALALAALPALVQAGGRPMRLIVEMALSARPQPGRETIAQLLPGYLQSRRERDLRPATLMNLRIWAEWFAGHWGARPAGSVRAEEIVALATQSRTRAMHVQAFFRWLAAQGRVRRDFDVGSLPALIRSDERQIAYLSVEDARAFLAAVSPECRAAFVLGLYAGLRPHECCRVEWSSIHLAERRIKIEAAVSKIRRGRMIEGVPPILWRLLRACPGERHGRVMPGRTVAQAIIRWTGERARAAEQAGVALSHDVLRHTFATYYVALTGNPALAAKVLGHYKLHTLAAHYDGVAPRAQARNYFREKR